MLRRAGWIGTEVDGGGHLCVTSVGMAQPRREGSALCCRRSAQRTVAAAVAEARGGATLDVSGRTKEHFRLTYSDDLAVPTTGEAPQQQLD